MGVEVIPALAAKEITVTTLTATNQTFASATVTDLTITGLTKTAPAALTIAAGALTVTKVWTKINTQGGGAADDLDTINGGTSGNLIICSAFNAGHEVTFKDGTGNLALAGDFTTTGLEDTIMLLYNGTNWIEISRSINV